MNRRQFLSLVGASALTNVSGCRWWLEEGLANPCLDNIIPQHLANHDVLLSAWDGIDPNQLWDCHAHLIGIGDSDSGTSVNANLQSWLHPLQHAQFQFYLDASCVNSPGKKGVDQEYVARLVHISNALPKGVKLMLLAFDHYHNKNGQVESAYSAFYTPNDYAASVAAQFPERFEWIASIHPYRQDSVTQLEHVLARGARAIKWLPGAMGIDPASPKCDAFYQAMVKYNIPLLTHSGSEHAVDTPAGQTMGNPLLLRRPLDQGVRVILAHSATTGASIDLDKGADGPEVHNFTLFNRLMSDENYRQLLFADISAVTQINRDPDILKSLIEHDEWHPRLLFGSDYPLPGVMPLISTRQFAELGYFSPEVASVLSEVRQYNVILYDFLLKRHIKINGKQFAQGVFQTRSFFNSI